MDEIVLVDSQ